MVFNVIAHCRRLPTAATALTSKKDEYTRWPAPKDLAEKIGDYRQMDTKFVILTLYSNSVCLKT